MSLTIFPPALLFEQCASLPLNFNYLSGGLSPSLALLLDMRVGVSHRRDPQVTAHGCPLEMCVAEDNLAQRIKRSMCLFSCSVCFDLDVIWPGHIPNFLKAIS